MNLEGKKVLVLGLGASGIASALKLRESGALVTANDAGSGEHLRAAANGLEASGVDCVLGSHPLEVLGGQELLVVSPGVPAGNPLLKAARERGIPVWSEIELAWRFVRIPVIAVTGTNGKTTTVNMIESILRQGGLRVKVAGNIGYPMVQAVDEQEGQDFLLLEVSSFQLAHIVDFAPRVAVILNIRDDHFDWHSDLEDYIAAKARIWLNQGPDDYLVLNLDDEHGAAAGQGAPSRHVYFSHSSDPLAVVYTTEGRLVSRLALRPEMALDLTEVMRTDELPLVGEHNLENALAATAVGLMLGVPAAAIREALREFQGLPHRLQLVEEVGGVRYFDDSKATNPDAALRAIRAFPETLIPILGGRNKGLDFSELAAAIGEGVGRGGIRGVVLMGEAASELEKAIGARVAKTKLDVVWDMEAALEAARKMSFSGDVVVLAPACASFDQYGSYAERGDHFQTLVRSMREEEDHAREG